MEGSEWCPLARRSEVAKNITKTDRSCPVCGTTFGAVADLCICPKCNNRFYASHLRATLVEPTLPAENVMLLTRVLSHNSPSVIDKVRLSIENPRRYFAEFGKNGHFFKSANDVDPVFAAHEHLVEEGFVGFIDWRSDPDELVTAVVPLLEKAGIEEFDWSFVKELESAGNEELLKNENLLNLVRDKLGMNGAVLVHFFMGWDNYDFALISEEDYNIIKHISGGSFAVRRGFA
jgi:hypothetical protein